MTLDEFITHLDGVATQGRGYTAQCPAHDDNVNSLSIGEEDGKILIKCHAGCRPKDVVEALGLRWTDLFPPRSNSRREIVAEYDYRDEHGTLLFQSVRFVPKTFCQRSPDGMGGWRYKGALEGVRRVLYRLPELVANPDETVFIVEGEKDVDKLLGLGLTATCNPCGADDGSGTKWLREFGDHLQGRRVVLLQDNDESGRCHCEWVASTLMGRAASIKVIGWPDETRGYDVSDYLSNGGTKDLLLELVDTTPEWRLGSSPKAARTKPLYFHTVEAKAPCWLINDLIVEEACIVVGAEMKRNKTWFTLLCGLALATEGSVLGLWGAQRRGKTLFVSPEGTKQGLVNRLYGLCWGFDVDPAEVGPMMPIWPRRLNLTSNDSVKELQEGIADIDPDMLVIDPLIAAIPGVEENDAGAMQEALDKLRGLQAAKQGLAVVVAHHLNKGNMQHSTWHRLRGSSAIGAWADGLISLQRAEDTADATTRIDVWHRDAPTPRPVGFNLDFDLSASNVEGVPVVAAIPDDDPPRVSSQADSCAALKDDIVSRVLQAPGRLSARSLAQALGKSPRTMQYHIRNLIKSNRLIRGDNDKLVAT